MNNTIELLQQEVADFISERDWTKYQTPKNLATSVAIEEAELLEIFQWDDLAADTIMTDEVLLELVNHEIADVLICLLGMANVLQIDLAEVVLAKIEYNKLKWDAEMVKETGAYRKEDL